MNNLPVETRSTAEVRESISKQSDKYAALILSEDGIIQDCSKEGARLLGYMPENLIKLHITKLLPKLLEIDLLKAHQINPYLRFLSRIGHRFELIEMNGNRMIGQLFFSDLENEGGHQLVVLINPIPEKKQLH